MKKKTFIPQMKSVLLCCAFLCLLMGCSNRIPKNEKNNQKIIEDWSILFEKKFTQKERHEIINLVAVCAKNCYPNSHGRFYENSADQRFCLTFIISGNAAGDNQPGKPPCCPDVIPDSLHHSTINNIDRLLVNSF